MRDFDCESSTWLRATPFGELNPDRQEGDEIDGDGTDDAA